MVSKLKIVITLYLVAIFILCSMVIPATDTYYYWTWAKNLQLSYIDGPPMVSYALWITTKIFGDNLFAINIWSFLLLTGSSAVIYKITLFISNKQSAIIASTLWLVYPFATTRFITVTMTLDGFETFFSLLILLVTCNLIVYKKTRYIYYLGFAVGLGLLAKYNIIILAFSLIIFFIINKDLRYIFKTPHLYIAAMISILIFSPVLVWNYINHWASFKYQLHSHDWNGAAGTINSYTKHGIRGMWFYLGSCVFGVLHIILITLFILKFKCKLKIKLSHSNQLIIFCTVFTLLFWLYKSYSSHVGLNYMLTSSAFLMIILGQLLSQFKNQKYLLVVVVVFMIISVVMVVNRCAAVKASDVENYNKYITSGLIKKIF